MQEGELPASIEASQQSQPVENECSDSGRESIDKKPHVDTDDSDSDDMPTISMDLIGERGSTDSSDSDEAAVSSGRPMVLGEYVRDDDFTVLDDAASVLDIGPSRAQPPPTRSGGVNIPMRKRPVHGGGLSRRPRVAKSQRSERRCLTRCTAWCASWLCCQGTEGDVDGELTRAWRRHRNAQQKERQARAAGELAEYRELGRVEQNPLSEDR